MTAPADVHQLLDSGGEILDRLRRREKELEEQLTAVRERLAAGEAVLVAVERWRCLPDAVVVRAVPATDDSVSAEGAQGTGLPLIERIALLLAQDPARSWTPEQVHRGLDVPVGSVHSSMSRLEKRGRLVRVERGAYRAATAAGQG